MAKRLAIPSKELQLAIVGPKESFKATRLQKFNLNKDIPVTTVDEIGSGSHVGTARDVPNVTLTFSAFDVGIKIFSVLTGTDYNAYPAGGVDISKLGEMDAIIYVKSDTANDYVKTAHARKLQIQNFAFNYSVDGEATEDYTAAGSEKRWLKYDVVVDKFTSAGSSFTLNQTPIQLKNGNFALSVISDGGYLTEVASGPAANEYSLTGVNNKTLTLGTAMATQVLAVYHANPTGDNWADVGDSTMPSAIRGRDVKINIAANQIPRVQSVTINGNLNVQPVKEMGFRGISGYQRQVPTIEGTITVLDTDTELMSLFTYGTTTSGVEWAPGEGCTVSGVSLEIQLLDPCDEVSPYTVVKTVYLDDISIVGESYSANVNNNTQQVFNFRSNTAHCAVYSGEKA